MGKLSHDLMHWRGRWVLLCVFATAMALIICPLVAAESGNKAEATELFAKADGLMNFRSPGSPPIRIEQKFWIWTRHHGKVEGTASLI